MTRKQNITPAQAEEQYRQCCETVDAALKAKRLAGAILAKSRKTTTKDNTRLVTCSLCHAKTPETTAHRHQGQWICDDNCWDDRLKASE